MFKLKWQRLDKTFVATRKRDFDNRELQVYSRGVPYVQAVAKTKNGPKPANDGTGMSYAVTSVDQNCLSQRKVGELLPCELRDDF